MSFLKADVISGKLCRIFGDAFDVADRIREIDSGYELYFNREKQRFEVYKNEELQSALPYETLDERAIIYLRKTRVENVFELLEEVDKSNLALQSSRENRCRDEREYKLKHLVSYLQNDRGYAPRYDEL